MLLKIYKNVINNILQYGSDETWVKMLLKFKGNIYFLYFYNFFKKCYQKLYEVVLILLSKSFAMLCQIMDTHQHMLALIITCGE